MGVLAQLVVEALSSLFWGAVGLDGRGGAGLGLRAQAGAGELGAANFLKGTGLPDPPPKAAVPGAG